MWKPNSPLGARPVTLALTRTLPPTCTKLTLPRTVLPLVGWRSAVALGPSGDMLWHAPSNAATARLAAIGRNFIEASWLALRYSCPRTADVRLRTYKGRLPAPFSRPDRYYFLPDVLAAVVLGSTMPLPLL